MGLTDKEKESIDDYFKRKGLSRLWENLKLFVGDSKGTGGSGGSVDGNAGTADKLKTAVNINGTSFDGSADITTDLWGAARNVTVADADATNTGASVSVNGSEDVTLKLPATIKAALNGNADTATLAETATKSVQDGDGNVIAETYLKSASISGTTDEKIDALFK